MAEARQSTFDKPFSRRSGRKSPKRRRGRVLKNTKKQSAPLGGKSDGSRKAMKPGWRKSAKGNKYFEDRGNRSDLSTKGKQGKWK